MGTTNGNYYKVFGTEKQKTKYGGKSVTVFAQSEDEAKNRALVFFFNLQTINLKAVKQ